MESEDTLRKNDDTTNRILEAINIYRQETKQQIDDLHREMTERFTKIGSELQTMKHLQLSFDVRLDR